MQSRLNSWREKTEQYALGVIEGRNNSRPATVLRSFLFGLSKVYQGAVLLRIWLYDQRLFRHHTLGCQVVSIGNLTVGGTGKTPVVEVFARELQQSGRRVAILSRGYRSAKVPLVKRTLDRIRGKRDPKAPKVVSDGRRLLLDSEHAGDEPYMLAANLPDVVVLVDKDRVKSGSYAISEFRTDTLILDDGFQYLSLKHRLEIVLIDKNDPFNNGHLLPRGLLREPPGNLGRADYIFITKSDGSDTSPLREQIRKLNQHAEIIECSHRPSYLQDVFTGERFPLETLEGKKLTAVSGIAQPRGFEQSLEEMGGTILYRKRFADHHRFTQQEIIDVINRSIRCGANLIITTEKDAVRFPKIDRRDLPVYFLRVEIEIISGAEDFQDCVSRICFN
jgi:tetraacyldisaccharide 4'-kinase